MARPARPWFRFYVEAVHDRKLRRLKPEHRWLFVACLAAARQSPVPGVLLVGDNDPMTLEDLVDFAAMPSAQVRAGMAALREAGVLELDEDDVWTVPAWADRQYESDNSAERVRKHRYKEQGCNAETPLPVTPSETEAETYAEREAQQAPTASASPSLKNGSKPSTNGTRGTRLPDEFIVTEAMEAWVTRECPGLDWDRETKKFFNHFHSAPGKSGVRLDWIATWRKWMLNAIDYRAGVR